MSITRWSPQASRLLAALALALVAVTGTVLVGTPTPAAAANPTFDAISPTTGSSGGGTPVTITGSNFVSEATVYIGSSAATNVVVVSSTQITANAPAGTLGSANILIVNPDNSAVTAASAFFYV